MANTNGLTIGKLAEAAGVNIETIRYYQRRKLLEEPVKPVRGQRRYTEVTLKRLRFIRRAKTLGFTLNEIGELLRLDDTLDCPKARTVAHRKLEQIGNKIAELTQMQQSLENLFQRCCGEDCEVCPILDALNGSNV